jgi:hypothetical protein
MSKTFKWGGYLAVPDEEADKVLASGEAIDNPERLIGIGLVVLTRGVARPVRP